MGMHLETLTGDDLRAQLAAPKAKSAPRSRMLPLSALLCKPTMIPINPQALQALAKIGPPVLRNEFVCPITKEAMSEPFVAEDGHTYERLAIKQWLQTHNTSPLTNAILPTKSLRPNVTL